MPTRSYNLNLPSNPFLQALYFLVGGILLIAAILMSAVVLAVALGVTLIVGLVVYARVWWLKRKLGPTGRGRGASGQGSTDGRRTSGEILEVEYTVVEERDESDRRS